MLMRDVNEILPGTGPMLPGRRVATIVRNAARAIRRWPDRALHAFRRARARELVLASAPVRSVLMVCHGNICRSPFAAVLLNVAATHDRLDIDVASAGLVGPHRRPPDGALRAAQRLGVDLSHHMSALIDRDVFMRADLVCVMEASQAVMLRARYGGRTPVLVLGDLDPQPAWQRTITDPWGRSDAVFDASYVRIERCVRELVGLLSRAGAVEDRRGT